MFAFLTSVLSVSSVFKTSQQVIQEKRIPLEIAGGEAAGFGESLKLFVPWSERLE